MISCDDEPVSCISCKDVESGVYEIGCLCVRSELQGKGIGTVAVALRLLRPRWMGNVKVVRFVLGRKN